MHCIYGSSPKRHLWEGVRVAVSRWRGSLRSLPPSETSDDLLSTLHCTSTSCWAPFILIKKSVRGIEPGRACKQLSAFPTTQKCVEASLMQKQSSPLSRRHARFPAQTDVSRPNDHKSQFTGDHFLVQMKVTNFKPFQTISNHFKPFQTK
jgi:hypothetical protein